MFFKKPKRRKYIPMLNTKRRLDNNLSIFVNALMWFVGAGDLTEKLGLIKLLLCNIHCSEKLDKISKDKIDVMINDIQKLLEESQENSRLY